MRLEWSPHAVADLRRLHKFLHRKSPRAADRAIATIRSSVLLLRDFPEAGRHASDSTVDHRELIVTFGNSGYVVAYTVRDDAIEVLDVRHQLEAGYDPEA